MKRRDRKSDCPVNFALEIFGDAWSLLVIRDLMFKGRDTYGDFLKGGEGIATNILADRLLKLEREGIIHKESSLGASPGHYRLTTKGLDLLPVLLEIIRWSAKYDLNTAADREFVDRLNSEPQALVADLRTGLLPHIANPEIAVRKGAAKSKSTKESDHR